MFYNGHERLTSQSVNKGECGHRVCGVEKKKYMRRSVGEEGVGVFVNRICKRNVCFAGYLG